MKFLQQHIVRFSPLYIALIIVGVLSCAYAQESDVLDLERIVVDSNAAIEPDSIALPIEDTPDFKQALAKSMIVHLDSSHRSAHNSASIGPEIAAALAASLSSIESTEIDEKLNELGFKSLVPISQTIQSYRQSSPPKFWIWTDIYANKCSLWVTDYPNSGPGELNADTAIGHTLKVIQNTKPQVVSYLELWGKELSGRDVQYVFAWIIAEDGTQAFSTAISTTKGSFVQYYSPDDPRAREIISEINFQESESGRQKILESANTQNSIRLRNILIISGIGLLLLILLIKIFNKT